MAHADADARKPAWLIANRNFVLLWAAYFIAAVGDNLNDLGQLDLMDAMEGEQSMRLMALMMFGLFLPYLLLGPVAGWCADRFSRKGTMIAADIARAAVVINFAVLIPLLRNWDFGAYTVMTTQMTLGVLAAFFSPARQALLPSLVRADQLVRANAMISALAPVGAMLGFTIGGFIVQYVSSVWNFRINGLTYMLSALLILCILPPRGHHTPTKSGSVWQPLADGFRYVRSHRRVWQMILLGGLFWGAAGVVYSSVPAIVKEVISTSYADVGLYRALPAIGMVIGAAGMTLIGPALGIRPAILSGLLITPAGLLLLTLAFFERWTGGFITFSLILVGFGGAILLVTINATLQRFVPNVTRGRVFGVSDMTTMGAMVLATGAIGLPQWTRIDDYVPWVLLATAAALLIAFVLATRIYRRECLHHPLQDVVWGLAAIYTKFWGRMQRLGPCTVPHTGPVIVAANHTSGFDGPAIVTACRHRMIGFVVDRKYYRAPIANWFMRLGECIDVDRENPTRSFYRHALERLNAGGCIGIFPEGTYVAPDEEQPVAREGVARLALRTGATVIPCHISGTHYDYNPFRALLRRHKVRIRFGQPVDLGGLRNQPHDRTVHRTATDRIMNAILALAPDAENHATP